MSSTGLGSTRVESRATVFAASSGPIPLHVLDRLTRRHRCVCLIPDHVTDVAPNPLSNHLRVLRDADRLVTAALPAGLTEVMSG